MENLTGAKTARTNMSERLDSLEVFGTVAVNRSLICSYLNR